MKKSLGQILTDFTTALESGEDIPGGAIVAIQLNIVVKSYGTCYVCVHLDGEEVIRAPFTIRQQPESLEKNGSPREI